MEVVWEEYVNASPEDAAALRVTVPDPNTALVGCEKLIVCIAGLTVND
jgi:hypothetical protein